MTPGAFAATLVAMRAGKLPPAYGPRIATTGGAVVLAATGYLLAFTLPDHPMFLAYWLPLGILAGAGMGAITTGTSTAAALSVSPHRFAGATGPSQTARQVGGAIGIAILVTVVSGPLGDTADFGRIHLVAALSSTVVALLGLGLKVRVPQPAAAAASPPPADDRRSRSADIAAH